MGDRVAEHAGEALDEVGQAGLFVAFGDGGEAVDREDRGAAAAEGRAASTEQGAVVDEAGAVADLVEDALGGLELGVEDVAVRISTLQ